MTTQPDLETERALLGAILQEPDKVIALCQKQGLSPGDFTEATNRKIFAAMMTMHAAGKPVITLTVNQETQIDILQLDGLLNTCPAWTHAEYYIEEIKQVAVKKRLLDSLNNSLRDPNRPLDGLIADVQEALQSATDKLSAGNQDPFPAIRLDDLQNYDPPPDYALAGASWLRRGAGCLLTGGTGLGKSVLAEQIAVSIAAGIKILGCIPVHSAYRVLYIEAENDEETLKRDILSIIENIPEGPCRLLVQANLHIRHVYGMAGNDFAAWLTKWTEKTKPDLIVIDPYQAFLSGQTDINNTASFFSWIHPINKIIQEFNCALLLVAHTPKPKDRESWTARESVYMAAGTSAISNWARTSAELTAAGTEDGRYRLRFGKNAERNGLTTELGGIVRDLYIEHSGSIKEPFWRVSDSQVEPTASGYGEKIIRLATECPSMSYREIAKQVGCSVGTINKWHPKNANN